MITSLSALIFGCSSYQLNNFHNIQKEPNDPIYNTDKRFTISYDTNYKDKIINTLKSENINVVYNLKNMNILVITLSEENFNRKVEELKKVKGIFDIQEDSTISLD